jgi:uncharacterized membrane protein YdfJ with MMPL/SSD domain
MTAIARLTLRHPRKIVAAWLLVLLASAGLALGLTERVRDSGYSVSGSQSERANLLGKRLFAKESKPRVAIAVYAADRARKVTFREAAVAARAVHGAVGVREVEEAELSDDERVALVPLALAGEIAVAQTYVAGIQSALDHARRALPGVRLQLVGQAAVFDRYAVAARQSLQTSAAISFPVTLAILLVAFLSAVAALLPLALAAVSVTTSLGVLYLLSYVVQLNVFVQDTVLVLGLGLSIDFSLFMVSRVREGLAGDAEGLPDAITLALRSTGRAIVVSGLTVAAALAGLFATGLGAFASLATGAIAATLVAVAAALTLTPAMLVLLGPRIERLPMRVAVAAARNGALWRWLASFVIRRRTVLIAPIVLVMLALAAPAGGLQISWRTFSVLPATDPVRQATDRVADSFGPGYGAPAVVMARASPVRLTTLLEHQRGVRDIGPPQFASGGWVRFLVALDRPADSDGALADVRAMRAGLRRALGRSAIVGGPSAEAVDLIDRVDARTPLIVALVLLTEIVFLTCIFAAPVIAVKAALTTLLSVAAALGVMTFLFGAAGNVHFVVPLFLFASVFGLSTDYEVFLISRVSELHRGGASATDSLAEALVRSSRSITLAGITMSVVFFSFAVSPLVPLQELGVGLGLAILLDVTIVRSLLVPATVALLGEWNWWRPRMTSRRSNLTVAAGDTEPR